jgi:hypothetical protein
MGGAGYAEEGEEVENDIEMASVVALAEEEDAGDQSVLEGGDDSEEAGNTITLSRYTVTLGHRINVAPRHYNSLTL